MTRAQPVHPNAATQATRCARGPLRLLSLVLAAAGLAGGPGVVEAQEPAGPTARPAVPAAPMFSSDDPVAFTILAPLEEIFGHRDQESEEYPGVVIVDAGMRLDTVEADIRTRGRSRLDRRVCRFPPLRLDVPRSRVEGTLFQDQDKLKLVTHCRDDEEYEQGILLESLAYRVFNLLTDMSFRVRLARITYEDSEGGRDAVSRYGFLIEHEEGVAARTGWSYLPVPLVPPEASDPEHLALLEVYQYMIGNTDWSAFSADPGSDECCHNTKPLGNPRGPVFALPYDFDITGLVNAPYARNLYRANLQALGLRSMRDRKFRGVCTSEPHWPGIFQVLRDKRGEIEALFRDQVGLSAETRDEALEYVGSFYAELEDEEELLDDFREVCLG
ncbi:MAG TPA: hypothetical protein VK858_02280 [Longimicrobiales bacterium]|nr:hypothetical protein [Longimicrobiales bacterium]